MCICMYVCIFGLFGVYYALKKLHDCMYVCMYVCAYMDDEGPLLLLTAIPIIIEGQLQVFQRFSSSKLVL
jgi:hypothetical protein